ncbi:hypothetical protein [Streptomyces cyaneofuscatus]|uniref:hypothetical protein n=1 Tax=Streptomyces cyaneofuscatus TaxID=66883 RepID=UPI003437043E
MAAGGGGAPPVPLIPHEGGGRGLVAVENERGDDTVVAGELNLGRGLGGGPAGLVQGGGDVGQVRGDVAGAQDGFGACGGAADLSGRVAELGGGLGRGQGRVGLDVLGDAVGAQPGQGVLPGVAVDTEPLGEGGGADGGVGVQQLGDERGDLVARDLVPGALGPTGLGRGVPGAGGLERADRVARPVLDPAHHDPGPGQGGVALVRLPGVRGHPDQGRALAAVQEVPVVLDLRDRRHGLAQEVGINLLAVDSRVRDPFELIGAGNPSAS